MYSFLHAAGVKAIRAAASGLGDKATLHISTSNMEGDCVSISVTLDLGAEGLHLAEAVAETINNHAGNGGFPVDAPGWRDNSHKAA